MNTFFLALIASVSARNFLIDEGIDRVAASMAEYRVSGVDSSSASALVSGLMGTFLDAPPISSFVDNLVHQVERQALSAGGLTSMKIDPTQMLQVMGQYKSALDAYRAQPDFEAFRKAVAADAPKFDSKKMISDVKGQMKEMGSNGRAKAAMASFTADPAGKQVVASAQELYNLHNQVFALHLPAFSSWLNML